MISTGLISQSISRQVMGSQFLWMMPFLGAIFSTNVLNYWSIATLGERGNRVWNYFKTFALPSLCNHGSLLLFTAMYSSVSRQFPSPSATRSCSSGNYFSLRWLLSEKRNTSCVLPLDLDSLLDFFHLKAKSFTLQGCCCSLFVSNHKKRMFLNSLLAEGTTKWNSKTSRLTGLNVLWALVPPSFFRRKWKSFFTSNIPDNKHRDNTTCEISLDFLLQHLRPFAKGSIKFSSSSTQPLELLTCLQQS